MSEKMMKKLIVDASDAELKDFAEVTLVLDVPERTTRADLMALIGPAWPAPHIFVEAADVDEREDVQTDEARAVARVRLNVGGASEDPKWLIRIANTELPGGRDPVPVGVNGRHVVIQRGVEVEVPHRYIEAIQNAVRISVTQDQRTQEMHTTSFSNYPLEIIERPSKADIAAWFERTKNLLLV
jgi:hypothetical protein